MAIDGRLSVLEADVAEMKTPERRVRLAANALSEHLHVLQLGAAVFDADDLLGSDGSDNNLGPVGAGAGRSARAAAEWRVRHGRRDRGLR